MAGAAFREILGDSRSAKCFIFPSKMRLQDATSKVSEAAGAFMIGMCPDHGQVIFESSVFWRKQFSDFSLKS